MIRRLINGDPADDQNSKIATKIENANTPKPYAAQGLEDVSGNTTLVQSQHPTNTPLKAPSAPTNQHTATTRTAAPKKWRNLSETEKLHAAHLSAEKSGALAFTIIFSERLQKTLQASDDPTRLLSGYIGRELRKALGRSLPHLFVLEISRTGKLHAHGVVVIGDDLDEDRILAIDRALGRAGGKLKAARITRQTQSYLDHLHNGKGWANYLAKARFATRRHLQTDKISYISTDLLRLAKG